MAIRSYRKPVPYKFLAGDLQRDPSKLPDPPQFMEVFVILESPLLELGQADLAFLKSVGVDIFG